MPGLSPAILGSSGGILSPALDAAGIIRGGGGIFGSAQIPGDWGDGVAFGTRPAQTSQILINGANGIVIDNLWFDGLANSIFQYNTDSNDHVCIYILNSNNVTVRNCDFYQVSECVAVFNSTNVLIEWNRVDGITGPAERVDQQTGNFVQTYGGSTLVDILNNKIKATIPVYDPWGGAHQLGTEDVISLFGASDSSAQFNQIDATDYVRDFGTGTILGDGSGNNCLIAYNTYLNPGQVGIAVAGGFDHVMRGNIIYREPGQNPGSGNTAAYYWDYNAAGMGNGLIEDNRAKFNDGGGLWNPGPPPAVEINNNWDDNTITLADVEVIL